MPHFSLRVTPSTETIVIVSVAKKVSKKAITRNLIKRRVRAAVRSFIKNIKPAEYLVITKAGSESIKGQELAAELKTLFKL